MEFKVGDYVKIKSIDWYNANKFIDGRIYSNKIPSIPIFTKQKSESCGKVCKIYKIDNGSYYLSNGSNELHKYIFNTEAFECIVPEQEAIEIIKEQKETEQSKKEDLKIKQLPASEEEYKKINQQKEIEIPKYEFPKEDHGIKKQIHLTPKKEFEQQRLNSIIEAIKLCHDNQIKINVEWVEEYNQRLDGLR